MSLPKETLDELKEKRSFLCRITNARDTLQCQCCCSSRSLNVTQMFHIFTTDWRRDAKKRPYAMVGTRPWAVGYNSSFSAGTPLVFRTKCAEERGNAVMIVLQTSGQVPVPQHDCLCAST